MEDDRNTMAVNINGVVGVTHALLPACWSAAGATSS